MKWAGDFETTTDVNDCRVWAFGLHAIGDDLFIYGNSLTDFMEWCENNPSTVYFHNLKFDGEFILNWLFRNGFTHSLEKHPSKEKSFTSLISDRGVWYTLELLWGYDRNGKKITTKFIDSLKILPMSVEKIAEGFKLPIGKLKIDYKAKREVGHELTNEEIAYIKNDVAIVAKALETLFNLNLNKMTQGSNAFHDYKNVIGKKYFKKWFPIPQYDADIRQAYKGGFTYLNPKYRGKTVGKGIVLDVNSLYPWVMHDCMLPYGEGIFFEGKYMMDKKYPLYIQMIKCQFELKNGYIPTIQLKNTIGFIPTEYLRSSSNKEITLCLTNVDLKLFLEHYDVYNLTFISGWKFRGSSTMFKGYVDKWSKIKIESTLNKNAPMRQLAKLMLNALYGKFGLNPNVCSKIPYLDNGVVRYKKGEKETRDPIYIPVATFVTAYAREKTIRNAQKVYDRFIYADTDSLHLDGTEYPEGLEIDDTKLGAWKHESTFEKAKFIRQKTYLEVIDGKLNITCAGMPERCYENVTFDNFKINGSFEGKLKITHCVGGIVLEDEKFTIRGEAN